MPRFCLQTRAFVDPSCWELNLYGCLLGGCVQGLAACHNLRELHLQKRWVGASHAKDKLDLLPLKVAHVPTSISALTNLTSLFIALCGQSLLAMQFSWLASLTSLQELVFHGAGAHVKLPSELTELTRLDLMTDLAPLAVKLGAL